MSFKICYDAQVLRGNLVSPEESFSKCPGKGKETMGKKPKVKIVRAAGIMTFT